MAAARCAARRLGGYLLQGTQAAVAEEGRRLVPSRFMRSRQLSTKHACRAWMEKKMQKLRFEVAEFKEEMEKVRREPVEKNDFNLRVESYARTIDGALHGAAKVVFICVFPFVLFAGNSIKGVDEAHNVSKGNQ